MMNSSPPLPNVNLPPISSSGKYGTPSPSPEPEHGPSSVEKVKQEGKERRNEACDIPGDGGRISMYVTLFDEMINTVIESEAYLFTEHELWVLRYILALPYEPHYLLTRLLLRRQGKIYPLTSLLSAYSSEIGEEGVKRALLSLSSPLPLPSSLAKPSVPPTPQSLSPKPPKSRKPWSNVETGMTAEEERKDPDLAEAIRESLWAAKVGRVESNLEGAMTPVRPTVKRTNSSSSSSTSLIEAAVAHGYEEEFSLMPKEPEAIYLLARNERSLSLEEIMACLPVDELRRVARSRKIPLSATMTRESTIAALKDLARRQTTLGFTPLKGKGKGKEKDITAQSRLPFSPHTSESLLLAQLLPLLGNHALELSPALHALISRVNLIFSRTPPAAAGQASLMLPSILVTSHKRRYPSYGAPTRSIIWNDRAELLTWERAISWEVVVADALGDNWVEQRKNPTPGFASRNMLSRHEGAKVVKRIWEGVWPVWCELVSGDKGQAIEVATTKGGLVGDRFQPGHILTRIVHKGAIALGILHEYDLECMVLRALLAQKRWRRGRRGAWYDRLALVLMNHYKGSPEEKVEKLEDATQVCIDGLLDDDTHMIYRPALSRRLTRLENKLDLPPEERHISHAELLKCETRELTAPRVQQNMGQPKLRGRAESEREREASIGLGNEGRPGIQQVGKSVWLGREGEVTVEGWVLEWWEKQGYKGYHSESSIITTLFGLLMWPILFHPLPGAFETVYQTAPLDLGEDTFASARRELIEARLEAMSKTSIALEMLREADKAERDKGTWAVGVNWEYTRLDLEEVLQCIGGKAMSGICRMLCEEYRHRISGVPDLIIWNFEKLEARFVEVKGPGDNLSETQKVWIDVLLSSGVPVEVCRVKAAEASQSAINKVQAQNPKRKAAVSASRKKSAMAGVKQAASGKENVWPIDEDENEDDNESGSTYEDGDEDEWRYESGEEGKKEGRWETNSSSSNVKKTRKL